MDNNIRNIFFLDIKPPTLRYIIEIWTLNWLVNTYKHVRFDEGMDYLEITTPNARQMGIALDRPPSEDQE